VIPDTPGARFRLANHLLSRGRVVQAQAAFERSLELAQDDRDQYTLFLGGKARSYFSHERYEDALTAFQSLLQLEPSDPDTLLAMADCQIRLGQLYEARTSVRRALRIRSDVEALRRLGWLQLQENQLDEAVDSFRRALRDRPGDVGSLVSLASVYEKQGDVARAYESLSRAARAKPDDALLRDRLALLEKRMDAMARR
jgi:tetratricopeptide (TPR) repeat protein